MSQDDRFSDLDFAGFQRLARDNSLSRYEKVGFPDSYRKDYEAKIFADICEKLLALNDENQVIMDIGAGCSDLPHMLIEHCEKKGHQLILIDSKEMLDQLPDRPHVIKKVGYYPNDMPELFDTYKDRVNAILVYSVIQYVYVEGDIFRFLDRSLSLLAQGGKMLVGDIPNISKRKRFFSSETGIAFHKAFMKTDEPPTVAYHQLEPSHIDDSVMMALMMRARLAGFDSYLLPQNSELPMANRREDLLFCKP